MTRHRLSALAEVPYWAGIAALALAHLGAVPFWAGLAASTGLIAVTLALYGVLGPHPRACPGCVRPVGSEAFTLALAHTRPVRFLHPDRVLSNPTGAALHATALLPGAASMLMALTHGAPTTPYGALAALALAVYPAMNAATATARRIVRAADHIRTTERTHP